MLKKEPEAREPVVKIYNVEVFPIRPTDIPEHFPCYGTAEALRDVVIAAKVSGEIKISPETHKQLKAGQVVSPKGPLLFLIDPSTYEERVAQAKLQVKLDEEELNVLRQEKANNEKLLARAKSDVAEYRKEYQRIENALKQNAAFESEVTKAKLELQRYETTLTRTQNTQDLYPLQEAQLAAKMNRHLAEQRLAEIDLKHTRIAVPFTGKLGDVHVEAGEYVRIGDPLVRLTDTSVVEIPMALSLDDYGKIERMLRDAKSEADYPRVSLAVSENSPFRWTGHVVRVSAQADEVTRTVKVYVRVTNNNSSTQGQEGPTVVVPRMHYFGLIEGPVLKQRIVIPRDAITGGRVFVATKLKTSKAAGKPAADAVTIYDGVAAERTIQIARTFRDLAVVDVGLEDGALPSVDVGSVDVGSVNVSAGDSSAENSAPASTSSAPAAPAATTAPSTNGTPVVSRLLFLIVAGYASAITIALIVVWFYYQRSKQLNLPDVVPKQTADGKISFNYYAEDAPMPSGHRLRLGETQRFGYLEITPLKVTQGPVLIADEYGEDPSSPVLKLWLKIRNVSDNQTFAPFGRTLARTRSRQHNRANVFVCRADQKRRDGDKIFMYDLEVDETQISLKGQNIDRALKPGESYETFLATDEDGIESLTGDLVWRVHVRKGYNPVSKWGITTLFEINFHRDQVKTENQYLQMTEWNLQMYRKAAVFFREDELDLFRAFIQEHPQYLFDDDGVHVWMSKAAHHGDIAKMELLVELGVDVNITKYPTDDPDTEPEGAIQQAADFGHLEAVRWLLDHGAEINFEFKGERRCWPLVGAATRGHLEIVKLLVERGADLEARMGGVYALSQAETYGRFEVRDYLLSLGIKGLLDITPPDFPAAHKLLLKHLGGKNGPTPDWQIALPGDPAVTIYHTPPTKNDPYETLFTVGLSDKNLPLGRYRHTYSELRMMLKRGWKLTPAALADPKHNWPVEWLKRLVEDVRAGDRWPEKPILFMNGDPPEPLAPKTKLSGWLCLHSLNNASYTFSDQRIVNIWDLFPIHTEEAAFVRKSGDAEDLIERFNDRNTPLYVDPNRKCAVK
eukprot:g33031.t1